MAKVGSIPTGLWAQLWRHGGLYAAGALLLIGQQALMAKRDLLVQAGVDAADQGIGADARTAAITLLGVSLVAAVVRIFSRVTLFSAGRNVEYELRRVLLEKIHRLSPKFFQKMATGDIMSRATSDLTQVRLLMGFGFLNAIGSVMAFASALYVMMSLSPKLTLAAMATFPLMALSTRMFSVRLFKYNRSSQDALGLMSDRVLASLSGIRVVRSFALEEAEMRSFEKVNQDYLRRSLTLATLRGLMGPVMGLISSLGVLIVFVYGGRLVVLGELSKGGFVSFWLALLRLTWPMLALGFVAAIVQRGRAGHARVKEIYDAPEEDAIGRVTEPEMFQGALSVKHLTFKRGETTVLHDVSFEVPAGTSLAIVGKTGSGKSTILGLLPRLLPTPRRSVFIDGYDVCDLPVRAVRSAVGFAQQEGFLFSTTVTQNIGFSLDDANAPSAQGAIEQAAAQAAIAQEVVGLPDGYDTVVGERGIQLSGGQRQRVALARALLREAPVLLLDDPLSAVDAETEAKILQAIRKQASQRTLVLVTHRIAAARSCDRIVVLDAGRIIQRGTHAELMREAGLYRSLAEEQEIQVALGEAV